MDGATLKVEGSYDADTITVTRYDTTIVSSTFGTTQVTYQNVTQVQTDGYGGSLQNRMRFPLEVFDAVRAAFPADKPVWVRVSATDWVPGGFASNGYGELSPGKYGLIACVVTEFVMTFFFLFIIVGTTSKGAAMGFAGIPIGLALTVIQMVASRWLFPEAGEATDAAAVDDEDEPVVLPWQNEERSEVVERRGASGIYLRYLDDRADSIVAALRVIAESEGATIVHCAAGKDRTGVVIACALAEVGVTRDAIVEDYTRSAERIEAVYHRLGARRAYRDDLRGTDVDHHRPRATTMERTLGAVDEIHGGIPAWLRAHGWTEDDAARLRHKLVGDQ